MSKMKMAQRSITSFVMTGSKLDSAENKQTPATENVTVVNESTEKRGDSSVSSLDRSQDLPEPSVSQTQSLDSNIPGYVDIAKVLKDDGASDHLKEEVLEDNFSWVTAVKFPVRCCVFVVMLRGYGLYILRLRLRSMKLGILCLVTTASVLTLTVWIRKDVRTNGRSMKHSVGWSNFTGVILLTYMRSGSSLTGDILQQNSNVFYVFEPLRILRDLIKHKKQIQWLNGTVSAIATLNTTDVKRQALIGWLTCNFSLVYAQSFEDSNFLYFGKQTASYNECIYKNYNITITDHSQNVTRIYVRTPAFRRGLEDKCLKRLQNACLSSKVRIIKTIRTSMLTAEAILTELKECKVIHVIRDPRATVLSQIRNDGCNEKRNSTLDCAKRHCENVWNDTLVKEKMLKRFPYRILTILYENVVSKPSLMAELMYKFVGMQFSEVISKYVNRIVLEGNVTGCNVCERSWQVGKHSNTSTYRKLLLERMKRIDILYINSVCKEVLNHYKYKFDIR